MNRIRVLVVDDAVVVRRLVADTLGADPEIEVVGTAANGRIGLQKLALLNPDVVTMDIEMPEMDGLAALTELRKSHPRLPVIMFSTLSEHGGRATLEALARGANDYVTKPANVGGIVEGISRCREELIPKIKQLAGRHSEGEAARVPAGRSISEHAIDAVAIGVSTGGPVALTKVLSALPGDLPVPVLVVQHMPPVFTRLLAERLATVCAVGVHEGEAGMPVLPGHVYIAPGGSHMTVCRTARGVFLATNGDAPENSCRPAADVLFRSAARVYGPRLLGAVLTGMGRDGMLGAGAIRDAGGIVVVQDAASSVVSSMPMAVMGAGFADEVLRLEDIAFFLTRRSAVGRQAGQCLAA